MKKKWLTLKKDLAMMPQGSYNSAQPARPAVSLRRLGGTLKRVVIGMLWKMSRYVTR